GVRGVWLRCCERQTPIQQSCAAYSRICSLCLELVILETERRTGPVHGRSTDGFTSPGREVGKVFRDTPTARRGALVQPRKLFEREPFIVVKRDRRLARACLEQNDLEALLAEFV